MRDSFGREIHYLRISLTDRCNFRCVYCMPEHGVAFHPWANHLTDDELLRVVRIAASVGFDRVRLTGGEPTVRPNLVPIVEGLASIPNIQEIAMTTNGMRLEKIAEPLARAGLNRVNVSIDTLAAERAGLVPIKLNAVIVRGYNEEDLVDLARLTLDHDWEFRFIEVMPLGSIADFQMDSVVTAEEMKLRIEMAFGPLEEIEWDGHNPSRPFRLKNGKGTIGFISSVSAPFCAGCDRVRLTSDGKLRLCLLRDDEVDLLTPLRAGASDDELRELISRAVYDKPWGHGLAEQIHPEKRIMSQI